MTFSKKTAGISALAVLVLICGLIFFIPDGRTNLVDDLRPVKAVSEENLFVLDSLKDKTPFERKLILNHEWPSIGKDLVAWLRLSGKIDSGVEVSSIEFLYGSGEAEGEDFDGDIHKGFFEDQLIAKISIKGRDKPLFVAVQCSNGLFRLQGDGLESVYADELIFTIGKRKGLVDYVSFEIAISLAKTFGLPIYKGKGQNRKLISAEEALETNTDFHQVMVLVFTGDVFNLKDMTYNGKKAG